MDFSPWDLRRSFRLHEAACLMAGVLPLSKHVLNGEELPTQAIPYYVELGKTYFIGSYAFDMPEDEIVQRANLLTSNSIGENSNPHILQSIDRLTSELVSRAELHCWIKATGINSAYSFASIGSVATDATDLAQTSIEPFVSSRELSETEKEPEFDKWRVLWRAVRFDENRVNVSMAELARFTPNGFTEIGIRDEKFERLRAKLKQIAERKRWVTLQMSVVMQYVAELKFTIQEMAESRQPLDVDDVNKRATEITLANLEIDARIAEHQVSTTESNQNKKVALAPPNTIQNVGHATIDVIPFVVTNAIQSKTAGDAEPVIPSWKVITTHVRERGYRSDLLAFLKTEMSAGKPRPKANDLVNAWMDKPPVDIVVIRNSTLVNPPKSDHQDATQVSSVRRTRNGIRYKISSGEFRYADLKTINARIKSLTELSH